MVLLSRSFAREVCAARSGTKRALALHCNTLPRISSTRSTLRAHFSTALHARNAHPEPDPLPATSFLDPARADLFYHLLQLPVFALSFVPRAPPERDAPEVLGWLPAEGEGGAGLNDSRENPRFREALHRAVREGLAEGCDEIWRNGAIQAGEGWMHIHAARDGRNPSPLDRIGDMDDIIGSVRIEVGEIIASTYQPMPSYRICTADGVTTLTEGLAKKLREVLTA